MIFNKKIQNILNRRIQAGIFYSYRPGGKLRIKYPGRNFSVHIESINDTYHYNYNYI